MRSHAWLVQIRVHGIARTVGLFDDELDAARAYDAAALRLRGTEGRLNFSPRDARMSGRSERA
jgi:hypothetical protein